MFPELDLHFARPAQTAHNERQVGNYTYVGDLAMIYFEVIYSIYLSEV